jgi:hypothetical protein
MSTITVASPAVVRQFHFLASEWHEATRFLSSPIATCQHQAYLDIIALGPEVVPLILQSLAESPRPWFAALRELTGQNPVPDEARGYIDVIANHWLAWGRSQGLI